MDSLNETGREKTYLMILSYLIIASFFVEVTFTKVNILGNTAEVEDWFISLSVVFVWSYFVWIFYQKTHWKFNERLLSNVYLRSLQNSSNKLIREYSIKAGISTHEGEIHKIDEAILGHHDIRTFMDATSTDSGFKIPVTIQNESGEIVNHDKELIVPYSAISIKNRIKANITFMIHDISFTNFTFPYILAIAAGISIILQITGIMN